MESFFHLEGSQQFLAYEIQLLNRLTVREHDKDAVLIVIDRQERRIARHHELVDRYQLGWVNDGDLTGVLADVNQAGLPIDTIAQTVQRNCWA